MDIIRATAKSNSRIQLGQNFSATLAELIGIPSESSELRNALSVKQFNKEGQPMKAMKSQPEVKTYNISHLRRVWDDFNNTNIEIAEKQRRINLTRTRLGVFTMCAMPTIFFLGPIGYVLTGIGVLGNFLVDDKN